MSDNGEWFAAKRYGVGAGLPISWQGWAITLAFGAITAAAIYAFGDHPMQMFAVLAPAIIVFMIICARTTRGGWRWRWGDED